MAAVCEVCGKHPSFGMSVSHSHRRTKRRWNPNIQRVRAVVNGTHQARQRLHLVPQGREDHKASQVKAVVTAGQAAPPSASERAQPCKV